MAKAHTLVDNFNDNAIDTARWVSVGNPPPSAERIRETNGRIEIRPAIGIHGYSTLLSSLKYDLTDSEVRVEVIQALEPAGCETSLNIALDVSKRLLITIRNRTIVFAQQVAGTWATLETLPYDAVAHRWLRLRERMGALYWETSVDGVEWQLCVRNASPFNVAAVLIDISAGGQPTAWAGVAIFDNFNVQGTTLARRVEERRNSARDVRVEAAELAAARRHEAHANTRTTTTRSTTRAGPSWATTPRA
jgi:hypothetical protein